MLGVKGVFFLFLRKKVVLEQDIAAQIYEKKSVTTVCAGSKGILCHCQPHLCPSSPSSTALCVHTSLRHWKNILRIPLFHLMSVPFAGSSRLSIPCVLFFPFCFRKNDYISEYLMIDCGSKWRQSIFQACNLLKINKALWRQLSPFSSACFRRRRGENEVSDGVEAKIRLKQMSIREL